ncbi:MAG: thioredoxin domain-containing protein [Chloroflexota bacterium]
MPNRLAQETSPYLLQHANNPVDWYPWGEEALARAEAEDRPILLSIGYSACHWCHVMEHESFENPEIAALMNQLFVNIKVDREERPDLDSIYMTAVQALTNHGGWPMTVFLTPQRVPFYGGTYFPPEDRGHMPGFPRVLLSIAEAYRSRRAEVDTQADRIAELLRREIVPPSSGDLTLTLLEQVPANLLPSFDRVEGGLAGAPKFPQAMSLEYLLRAYARSGNAEVLDIVALTLRKMAGGGIYDQLGGGFHRYSVDHLWLVPHFEKMLYDNALLARVYLHAYLVTREPLFRRVVEETLEYVRREMTHPSGGFFSTQDADSEGEEGRFFVWSPAETEAALGAEDAALFGAAFDVTPSGNFEGHSILHVVSEPEWLAADRGMPIEQVQATLERCRRALFEAREGRVHPGRDEKVLTAWNGMMCRAFAEAGRALDRADWIDVAVKNVDFVLRELRVGTRLLRTWKDGEARLNGYLEDYANTVDALISVYEATFLPRWLEEARSVADVLLEQFSDERGGAFYDTGRDHERLITRPKDIFDNATPSGSAVAAEALLRLALQTGEVRYRVAAEGVLRALAPIAARHPASFGRLLCALDTHLGPVAEIAIVGGSVEPETGELIAAAFQRFLPRKVVAGVAADGSAAGTPLLEGRARGLERPVAYVCEGYVCQAPVSGGAALAAQLDRLGV